ncbi:MAG TPA: complex I NDUFA9 subunit family protein, partial [Rhizomicrobium sp.]
QLFKGNVRDEDSVTRALQGADAAVNLTGVLYIRGAQSFDALHADAARRIARLVREAGIKTLVHISAIGADPDAVSHYARSKGAGEKNLREEFPEATILRPSLVFGPEDQFFNKFAWLARLSPVLPLIGGGRTKFQPVFVGDVAAAILRALSDPATRGKTYELGGPAVYTFKELLQLILRQTGRKRLLVPLPFFLASIKAFFLQLPSLFLPAAPLLTLDQVRLLKTDNVVHEGALPLADLGIVPSAVEAIVPSYLWRFRAKGQFQEIAQKLSD